jgi:hypothetical protein
MWVTGSLTEEGLGVVPCATGASSPRTTPNPSSVRRGINGRRRACHVSRRKGNG